MKRHVFSSSCCVLLVGGIVYLLGERCHSCL